MPEKMVSIISPCYNGESYVYRFIESVLNQDYPKIELILVDDGSTDRTKEAILKYKEAFEQKGYKLIYILQEHAGQAEAINKGLKVFQGEYLTWFDSDDFMTPDSISKRVKFLEDHPEYGFCCCHVDFVDEKNTDRILYEWGNHKVNSRVELFENIMFVNHALYPDGYMVHSDKFLELFPDRNIYAGKEGQNWQLLLPLAYNLDCGFMNEVLCKVLTRTGSHSRMERSADEQLHRIQGLLDILLHVLEQVQPEKMADYTKSLRIKYARESLRVLPDCKDKSLLDPCYNTLKDAHVLNWKDHIKYEAAKNVAAYCIFKMAKGLKRLIK